MSNASSSAFSRLSSERGSGRSGQQNAWDRSARPGSGRQSRSSSSTPSVSPTTPMQPSGGAGLVPEHRIRPGGLSLNQLPSPGGGRIPLVTSPEQEAKRGNLKISFSQPNMRKYQPGVVFPSVNHQQPHPPPVMSAHTYVAGHMAEAKKDTGKFFIYNSTHSTGKLKFDGEEFDFKAEDLNDLGEIGRGNFGTVNKMQFRRCRLGGVRADSPCDDNGNKLMAVKRIRSTVDEREQRELLMDLEVVMKSSDCPFIVTFFGAIFKEGDCWICMELMDTSLDKFYKFVYERLQGDCGGIPEKVIGKITVATVRALNYLKERLRIIHRDVKPSNILLDRRGGAIKLCDFGISGRLVDSIAKTRDAGCRPYMAPERIDPHRAKGYDVRSDVWSLGITLVEVSTGKFPYPKWNSVFEQLQQVVHGDPPRLDPGSRQDNVFTLDFVNFVNTCLIKDEQQRPKYTALLKHNFIKRSEAETLVDVAGYFGRVLDQYESFGDVEMRDAVNNDT